MKRKIYLFLFGCLFLFLPACTMRMDQEIDAAISKEKNESEEVNVLNSDSEDEEEITTAYIYELEAIPLDEEKILETFFDTDIETYRKLNPIKEGSPLVRMEEVKFCLYDGFSFYYENDMAHMGLAFEQTLSGIDIMATCNDKLYRTYFPKESIDGLSKEEAVKEIEKYAEVLGVADANVNVYALTVDDLEYIRKNAIVPTSGPGGELDEYGCQSTYEPWEKQYEAYAFFFTHSVEGTDIVNVFPMNYLYLIYAREYGVVSVELSYNVRPVESTKRVVNIMSKTDMIKQLCLLHAKQSAKELNITSIDLVYYSVDIDPMATDSESELRPAWRVIQGETTESYYDAITGNQV